MLPFYTIDRRTDAQKTSVKKGFFGILGEKPKGMREFILPVLEPFSAMVSDAHGCKVYRGADPRPVRPNSTPDLSREVTRRCRHLQAARHFCL
jgi:hypothetical protein